MASQRASIFGPDRINPDNVNHPNSTAQACLARTPLAEVDPNDIMHEAKPVPATHATTRSGPHLFRLPVELRSAIFNFLICDIFNLDPRKTICVDQKDLIQAFEVHVVEDKAFPETNSGRPNISFQYGWKWYRRRWRNDFRPEHKRRLAFLCVCKQMHAEGRRILFEKIVVGTSISRWPDPEPGCDLQLREVLPNSFPFKFVRHLAVQISLYKLKSRWAVPDTEEDVENKMRTILASVDGGAQLWILQLENDGVQFPLPAMMSRISARAEDHISFTPPPSVHPVVYMNGLHRQLSN